MLVSGISAGEWHLKLVYSGRWEDRMKTGDGEAWREKAEVTTVSRRYDVLHRGGGLSTWERWKRKVETLGSRYRHRPGHTGEDNPHKMNDSETRFSIKDLKSCPWCVFNNVLLRFKM